MKPAIIPFAVLLLMALSLSASISGTFYSAYTLEPVGGPVILEAKGPVYYKAVFIENYSLDLAPGNYSMEAYTPNRTLVAEPENVSVENGTKWDFVLFYADTFEATDTNISTGDINADVSGPEAPMDWKTLLLAVSILFIVMAIIIFIITGRREELHEAAVEGNRGLSEDEDKFLLILYENEGIIEQTELRKGASWSDAKASLLAKSLESQGYVKRIRKGRKNIVKATEKGNAFNQQRRQ